MEILLLKNGPELAETASLRIAGEIFKLQKKPKIYVGLSGGSTPVPVYRSLSKAGINWEKIVFFLVDERYVESPDSESNRDLIQENLLQGPAGKAIFLFPDTGLPLDKCVKDYDRKMEGVIPDVVILGMGADGHIASLFPPLKKDAFGSSNVIHTVTNRFKIKDRISLTIPVLKNAKRRFFLISGDTKKNLFDEMQRSPVNINKYPAQAFFDERTTWISALKSK